MGFQIQRNNFISLEKLASSVVEDMLSNGFQITSINQQLVDLSIPETVQYCLLKATTQVDPLAEDGVQPWHVFIVANDELDTLDFYTCTPTQIIMNELGEVTISISKNLNEGATLSRSGFMFKGSETKTADEENHFFSYKQWGFEGNDEEAVPLSYFLVFTDHGVGFCLWAESYDKNGDKFGWWVIQRMVDTDGSPIEDGKSPLFCVFSHNGGGGTDLNVPEIEGILKFVVRESDVNTPTFPVSAVKDTADSARIINSVQQTSIFEDGKFIINFPRSLNSQRYSYPHELDMIAYASADVTSQYAEHEVTVYGEAQPRKYKAFQANHSNNKGMRIYFQVTGLGLDIARP
jgi:hypothetical protein